MISHVQIRSMFNMKLFIDTDADSRLSKRVLKDVDELGRDLDQVSSQLLYHSHSHPCSLLYFFFTPIQFQMVGYEKGNHQRHISLLRDQLIHHWDKVPTNSELSFYNHQRQVLHQYINYVKPAFEEFCMPTKKFADVIIPRGPENK